MCRRLSLPLSLSLVRYVFNSHSSFFPSMVFSFALIAIVEIPKLGFFIHSTKNVNIIGTRAINWSRCVFHQQSVMSCGRVCVMSMYAWVCVYIIPNSFSCSQTGKIFHCDNELFWQMSHQIQWIFCFVNLGERIKTFPTSKKFYAYMFHRAHFFHVLRFKHETQIVNFDFYFLFCQFCFA